MAAVKAKKPVSKLKAGKKKKVNKWLIVGGVAAVAIIGAVVVRFSSAATCNKISLRQGSTGACVKDLQGMLNGINYVYNSNYGIFPDRGYVYGAYVTVDGQFGAKTKGQVQMYQNSIGSHALRTDGVVDQNTWNSLCANIRNRYVNSGFRSSYMGAAYVYAVHAGCPR